MMLERGAQSNWAKNFTLEGGALWGVTRRYTVSVQDIPPGRTSLPAGDPFASAEEKSNSGKNVHKKVRGRG